MSKWIMPLVGLGVVAIVAGLTQAGAAEFAHMTVVGQKQGAIKGKLAVIAVEQYTTSPRDPQSGLPTGQRINKPIVIIKECDAASPQLFQAICTNENLTSVTIEFVETESTGRAGVGSTLKLTNANMASFRQFVAAEDDPTGLPPGTYEEISLTYAKMSLTFTSGAATTTTGTAGTAADGTAHATTKVRHGGTLVKPKS